jgi:hypothetical protein
MTTEINTTATVPTLAPTVIKTDTCESLSGRSTLTYHIGYTQTDDVSHVYIRIHDNTGHGIFNNGWVALNKILDVLLAATEDKPLGSAQLRFVGSSANTPGFILAALKQEGIIKQALKSKRHYVMGDISAFDEDIKARIEIHNKAPVKKAKGMTHRQPTPCATAGASPGTLSGTAGKTPVYRFRRFSWGDVVRMSRWSYG